MLQRWLSPSELGPSPQRLQGEEEAVVAQDVMLCTPVRSLKEVELDMPLGVFAVLNPLEPPSRLHPTKLAGLDVPSGVLDGGASVAVQCHFAISPLPEAVVAYWPSAAPKKAAATWVESSGVTLLVAIQRDEPFRVLARTSHGRHAEAVCPAWTRQETAYADANPNRMGRLVVVFDAPVTIATHDSLLTPVSSVHEPSSPIRSSPLSSSKRRHNLDSDDVADKLLSSPPSSKDSTTTKRTRHVAFNLPDDHKDKEETNAPTVATTPNARSPKAERAKPTAAAAAAVSALSSSVVPTGRWGHAMAVSASHVWVFGGQGEKQELQDDRLWSFDIGKRSWKVQETQGSGPGKRMGHSALMSADSSKIVVFGGSKYKRWFADVLVLDVATSAWETMETTGKVPALAYHSCTLYDRNLVLVFGGIMDSECSDTLFCLDIEQRNWFKPFITGERPCARSGHTATLVGSLLVIFGGWDAPIVFSDVYILDLVTFEFVKPDVQGDIPSPRSWHTATLLPNGSIFVYGGFDGNDASNDAFVLSGVSTTPSEPHQLKWTKVSTALLASARAGHTCTLSSDAEHLVVFGGGDNEGRYFNGTDIFPADKFLNMSTGASFV